MPSMRFQSARSHEHPGHARVQVGDADLAVGESFVRSEEELSGGWSGLVERVHVPVVRRSPIAFARHDSLGVTGREHKGCSFGNTPAPPTTHDAEDGSGSNVKGPAAPGRAGVNSQRAAIVVSRQHPAMQTVSMVLIIPASIEFGIVEGEIAGRDRGCLAESQAQYRLPQCAEILAIARFSAGFPLPASSSRASRGRGLSLEIAPE